MISSIKATLKAILGTTITLVATSVAATPASAAPAGKVPLVVIQGATEWTEVNTVLMELNYKWGIPVTAGKCTGKETVCTDLSFYSGDDGAYGWGRPSGKGYNGILRFNRTLAPASSAHRKAIVYHEFGHVFNLPHSNDTCKTSMAPCTNFHIMGYTAEEHRKAKAFVGVK